MPKQVIDSFVAIDFETANAKPSSICSVGAIRVEHGQIVDKYYSLVRPTPNDYHPGNIRVHGIYPRDTATAPNFAQVWTNDLSVFIGTLPLVAHNKSFDESCLRATLAHYGLPLFSGAFYCTCIRARQVLKGTLDNHRLPTVALHCGYDLTTHHHALADAEACAHIALRLGLE